MYVLHSAMQSTDQKKVFNAPPSGVRKIVSTFFQWSIILNYVNSCNYVFPVFFCELYNYSYFYDDSLPKSFSAISWV